MTDKNPENKNLDLKIFLRTILSPTLIFILLLFSFWVFALPTMRTNLRDSKKMMIKELTSTAWDLIDNYNKRVERNELSIYDAQRRVKNRLKNLRYGPEGKNYFWIIDTIPRMVMHPYVQELEGQDLSTYQDSKGNKLFQKMVSKCREQESGFVNYSWQWKDMPERIEPKVSYVKIYSPWQWIIGTGLYLNEVNQKIDDITRSANKFFIIFGIIGLIFTISISYNSIKSEQKRRVALKNLAEKEKNLRITLNSIGDAVIVTDKKGEIVRINPIATELTGWNEDDAKGKDIHEVFNIYNSNSGEKAENPIDKVLATGGIQGLANDTVLVSRNGNEYQIADSGAPIKDNDGNINGVVLIFRDVTEEYNVRQKLKASEAKYRTLISSMSDIIFLLNEKDKFIDIHYNGNSPLFINKEDLIGKKHHEVMPSRINKKYCKKAEKVRETGKTQRYEYPLQINGKNKWFIATLYLYKDTKKIVARIREITKRKKVEQELKQFFEINLDLLCIADTEGNFLKVNKSWESLLGYTVEELENSQFMDFIHSGDIKETKDAIAELKNNEQVIDFDNRYRCKDGSYKYLEWQSTPVDNKIYAAARDITDHIEYEKALRKSRERYKTIFNNTGSATVIIKEDTTISLANEQFEELSGYSKDEVEGKMSWTEFVEPPDLDRMKTYHKARRQNKENIPTNYKFTFTDGYNNKHRIFCNVNLIPGTQKTVASFLDITHTKQLEERFTKVWASAQDGMRLTDKNGKIIKVNQAFCKMVGMEKSELEGSSLSVIYKKHGDYIIDKHCKRFKNRSIPEKIEDKFQLHNGKYRWFEVTNSFVKSPNGEDQILAIFRDITAKKNAQEQLKEQKMYFEELIESAPEAITILDVNDRITRVNREFTNLFGYTKEEARDHKINDLIIPQNLKNEGEEATQKVSNGKKIQMETIRVNKNGEEINVSILGNPIKRNGKIIAVYGIYRDITDRVQAETDKDQLQKQLLQTQKLKSIGTLAGGVAHDFNNILTVIIGLSQMVLERLDKSDPNYNQLESILDAGTRAADLTKQLLLFSRKEDMEFEMLNINIVISELRKMLNRLIGEDIEMQDELDTNLWPIKADKNQIEQVITNLVVNARDAMPNGGELTIRTKNVIIERERAKAIPDIKPGKYIRLCIEDTGKGMVKEVQDKIFDPFFTTKGRAEGTGMGLSVVHGIVKEHGGLINVYSEPGEGTVFKIYLPTVKDKSEKEQTDNSEQYDQYEGRGETILIVEDEKPVLKYLESILHNYGYNYISVESGEQALKLFGKRKNDIDLLISDVIMTGIDGVELADKLKKENKGLGVILGSGYSNKKVAKSKIKNKGYRFIQKPYDIKELLKQIHTTIN